jgi:hypothetical protein
MIDITPIKVSRFLYKGKLEIIYHSATRCQCISRMEFLVRCCWAPAMSLLAGRSVMTCSRTQPPGSWRVLESEKRHLRFLTAPASVDSWPRLAGFSMSIALSVPPGIVVVSVWLRALLATLPRRCCRLICLLVIARQYSMTGTLT